MNDQTRIRLAIIEAKYGKRGGRAADQAELLAERTSRFDEEFRQVRDEVLAPILEEIGAALTAAGYGHRVAIDAGEHRPSVELHLILDPRRGAEGESTGVVRFFSLTRDPRACEIIAEVQLKRTLVELTRFQAAAALSPEVVEQMVVDAVEQVFAYHSSNGGALGSISGR